VQLDRKDPQVWLEIQVQQEHQAPQALLVLAQQALLVLKDLLVQLVLAQQALLVLAQQALLVLKDLLAVKAQQVWLEIRAPLDHKAFRAYKALKDLLVQQEPQVPQAQQVQQEHQVPQAQQVQQEHQVPRVHKDLVVVVSIISIPV
jgi:hypothetical protein